MSYRTNEQVSKALAPHIKAVNKTAANDWALSYDSAMAKLQAELHVSGKPTGIRLSIKCPYFNEDNELALDDSALVGSSIGNIFELAEAATKLARFIKTHEADIAAAVKEA